MFRTQKSRNPSNSIAKSKSIIVQSAKDYNILVHLIVLIEENILTHYIIAGHRSNTEFTVPHLYLNSYNVCR